MYRQHRHVIGGNVGITGITHIDELRAQFRGPLIGPADPGYDTARAVNNAMIDNAANRAWVRDYWSALRPHSAGGPYVNFAMADEGDDRVAAIYRGNYQRLRAVKRDYDPVNLFRQNQNIAPA